jgi:hypothetical protein
MLSSIGLYESRIVDHIGYKSSDEAAVDAGWACRAG